VSGRSAVCMASEIGRFRMEDMVAVLLNSPLHRILELVATRYYSQLPFHLFNGLRNNLTGFLNLLAMVIMSGLIHIVMNL
jgi:hypothetical protein